MDQRHSDSGLSHLPLQLGRDIRPIIIDLHIMVDPGRGDLDDPLPVRQAQLREVEDPTGQMRPALNLHQAFAVNKSSYEPCPHPTFLLLM